MFRLGTPKVYLTVSAVTLVVLIGAFVLGLMSANKMREIISEQFNQQQLTLAKSAASGIEEKFSFLKNELHTLNLSPAIQYLEVSWPNRMQITLANVKPYGVQEIGLVDASDNAIYRLDGQGESTVSHGDYKDKPWLEYARRPENRNKFFLKLVSPDLNDTPSDMPLLLMALPTYQVSVDESHPRASEKFVGCLYFLLDPAFLARKYAQDIRSGHTGYAWVIDRRGFFLYHPEPDFIGKDAFEVREKRDPKVNFSEINRIQGERMLTGEEGVSWYWSGWHRGIAKKMKKFIAFAPITLSGSDENITWSVAVVAPQTEVEGAVHEVFFRQFLLQGFVILIIIFGGGTIIYYEGRWSAALEEEVQRKTEALKQSRDELAKSEKLYKSLVESAEDSIFNVDAKGEILSINRYGAKFFGYTLHGIVGKHLNSVLAGEAGDKILRQVQQVFTTKVGMRATHEVAIGDSQYYLNLNLTPIRENDYVHSVLIIAHDVTTSRKMEEQLYFTEKLASLGQLAAGVAHEINNPLAIILGYADMLLEKAEGRPKEEKILQTIIRQGLNCKKIVENLMTFARAPEKVQYDTDVNRNIELVMEVVRNTLLTKKVEYRLDLAEDLPRVQGDAAQMQQVFMNLVTNAIKAMPDGGRLTITTRLHPDGRTVQIFVTDTGIGIKKEHLPKIFDPFFTTGKVGEGTGLGLSVSYAIISKFGGTIECTSKARDEGESEESGTTFAITLPTTMEPYKDLPQSEDKHARENPDH